MTDRKQAIATLTEHLDHWKRLLSEGICTKDEGERTIDALTFAIESIKVDLAYDLAYEKVDFIEIPEGATNGDMMRGVFPNMRTYESGLNHLNIEVRIGEYPSELTMYVSSKWLNSLYRKEQE